MPNRQKLITPGLIAQLALAPIVLSLSPMLVSGRWTWWEAWAYALLLLLTFVVSRVLAARRHPDLLAERARFAQHEDTKPWDRVVGSLVGIGVCLLPVVAGAEARLASSPPFSMMAKIVALLLIVGGYVLSSYALIENRFFSVVVRIQQDRGQHVVSSGPYRWVRHPGYAGGLLAYWATPVLLDSRWAFVATLVLTILLLARTALEDRTLQEELPGYREYTARVRFRLVPGVW